MDRMSRKSYFEPAPFLVERGLWRVSHDWRWRYDVWELVEDYSRRGQSRKSCRLSELRHSSLQAVARRRGVPKFLQLD